MSARRYPVVVKGELGPRYGSGFDGMTLSAHGGMTEITGRSSTSSHLYGVLERIAGFGLAVHSLTPLDTEDEQADAPPHTQPAGVGRRDPGANSERPT